MPGEGGAPPLGGSQSSGDLRKGEAPASVRPSSLSVSPAIRECVSRSPWSGLLVMRLYTLYFSLEFIKHV